MQKCFHPMCVMQLSKYLPVLAMCVTLSAEQFNFNYAEAFSRYVCNVFC